ncbi:MAG TPA: hypothetical protein VE111_18580 [Bradyrhizobium sp.]|nr:hypothetical protein [Bradyrhizobium sp.]
MWGLRSPHEATAEESRPEILDGRVLSAIIPISSEKPARLIGAPRIGPSATIAAARDGTWVFTGFEKTLSQPGRIAFRTKGDSITRFDQIEIANPSPTVFTVRGYQHKEIRK